MTASFAFADDTTLKRPNARETAHADMHARVICLVEGRDGEGHICWHYVGIIPSKYDEFITRTHAGEALDLSQYGDILLSGKGAHPSPEDQEFMRTHYGFDEGYLASLGAEVYAQQQAELQKKEAVRIDSIVAMLKKKQAE